MNTFDYTLSQPEMLADLYMSTCESSQASIKKNSFTRLAPTILLAIALSSAPVYAVDDHTIDSFESRVKTEMISKTKAKDFAEIQEIRVHFTPKYDNTNIKAIEQQYMQMRRVQMLEFSFRKNRTANTTLPFEKVQVMHMLNKKFSHLSFDDSILQYNAIDDAFAYNLFLGHDIELTVNVYLDELDENDFSIYHKGELILSGTTTTPQLIDKMGSVMSKIEKHV